MLRAISRLGCVARPSRDERSYAGLTRISKREPTMLNPQTSTLTNFLIFRLGVNTLLRGALLAAARNLRQNMLRGRGALRRPNPSPRKTKTKSAGRSSSHTRLLLSLTPAPLTYCSHLMPTLGPYVRTQTATYAVWSIMGARKREQPQFKLQFDPPAPSPTLRQQQQQHGLRC
jgi:hypothetical protein